MDRCRCLEYQEAVDKLRFYTVGTYRCDIMDNFDRSEYGVKWVKHGVDYEDMKFSKPKAYKISQVTAPDPLPNQSRKIEQMWCPYMTPLKK